MAVRCCVHISQSNIFVNGWWLCWLCIQCVYNVYTTYLHIRGCKQCVCMVVWLLTLNCRVISLWMVDDCVYNVYATYLQHTYTRECIVIGVDTVDTVDTVVTHSQIYYSAMIFMQCVCWLLIEIILHIPMKLFLQDDFNFMFSKKSKWNHSKVGGDLILLWLFGEMKIIFTLKKYFWQYSQS